MRAPRLDMLLVTGVTGFVGRTLLRHLGSLDEVRFLVRAGAASPELESSAVVGDLSDPPSLESALAGVTSVIHLAARTGKARRAEFLETNVEGTRRLLEAARRAGVESFVFVSTIAATYPDKRSYPYAESKERAEELVRESGIRHAILRPTVVLGPGSSVGASLASLAGLPLLPVFGPGNAPVQPVHVEDVARALVHLLRRLEKGEVVEGAFDLGGPEVVSFEELMRRLARAIRGREPRAIHLPVGLMIPLLAAVEPLLLPLMPVTAGQLAAFVNDGRAREGKLHLDGELRGLDLMIAETVGG